MAAADPSYSTPNYHAVGSQTWHVGGTLELGNSAEITVNAAGIALITGLPTADPHVVNAMWNNAGVFTISAG